MSIITPAGKAYPSDKIDVIVSDENQEIQDNEYLTGSVAAVQGYLNKAIFFKIVSSSAQNVAVDMGAGTLSGAYYIGMSYDNSIWNYIRNRNLSGSILFSGEWYMHPVADPVPYIRGLIYQHSGSTCTGSIYIIGFKKE